MSESKVIFITGGSSGFGEAIIKKALQNNHKVIATFRKQEEVNVFNSNHGHNALGVLIDVTNSNQIKEGVNEAIKKYGQIDVLINNAGMGVFGLFESIDREKYTKQFDVNVMGLIDVTNAILPYMRKQKSGQIFNLSSAAGMTGMPGISIYSASKFAVEGLSISLKQEVAPFNIGVTLIEPSAFNTQFFNNSTFDQIRKESPEAYSEVIDNIEEKFGSIMENPEDVGDPDKLALIIVDLINHGENPQHVPMGDGAVNVFENKIEELQSALNDWKDIALNMKKSDTLEIEKSE